MPDSPEFPVAFTVLANRTASSCLVSLSQFQQEHETCTIEANSMKASIWILSALMPSLILTGCMSAQDHAGAVREDSDKVTVGNVQREIHVGMSGAEVVAVLGSPNVVTTDEDRHEVWVYDKVATEARYSRSSGGLAAVLLGGVLIGDGLFGGAGGGSTNYAAGASSTSQRTLTVVIYYDAANRVRDFAYHSSSF